MYFTLASFKWLRFEAIGCILGPAFDLSQEQWNISIFDIFFSNVGVDASSTWGVQQVLRSHFILSCHIVVKVIVWTYPKVLGTDELGYQVKILLIQVLESYLHVDLGVHTVPLADLQL